MTTHKHHSEGTQNPANGEEKEPPTTKAQAGYAPPPPYKPEDFSQSAINRGQRLINGELVLVDQKIAKAIEELKNVLATALSNVNFASVQAAIEEVKRDSKGVAGIIPPGCDYVHPPPPPSTDQ
jgi:hypothetical protein